MGQSEAISIEPTRGTAWDFIELCIYNGIDARLAFDARLDKKVFDDILLDIAKKTLRITALAHGAEQALPLSGRKSPMPHDSPETPH